MVPRLPQPSNFWYRVSIPRDPQRCWTWTGGFGGSGYGRLSWDGKKVDAHRLSWILHYGAVANGLCVCHRCDNTSCVNPLHMFLGTKSDNLEDMRRKGRSRALLGLDHPSSKLSRNSVLEIRKAAGTKTNKQQATMHGVSEGTISRVVRGDGYKEVV